ncbi:MAG TPA: hypothetical protein VMV17_24815 [Streptosporangiaceae bacterium]|nr:hypothetical protein [Streptosporangiaceae bacterium]
MSTDDYRRKLADFLTKQPETSGLAHERVLAAQTRQDLGISSLTMVLLLTHYVEQYTDNTVTIRPEWVSRLGDVDGIASVLREIDAASLAPAQH